MFQRRKNRILPLCCGSPNASPEVLHRPRSQSPLHFDTKNIKQIRMEISFSTDRRLSQSAFRRSCVLLCFIKPILGNRYVRSRGLIVSEPRETHPRSKIADVLTLTCPPFDKLGCPDPHPLPYLRRWLHRSPPLPLRTDLKLLR